MSIPWLRPLFTENDPPSGGSPAEAQITDPPPPTEHMIPKSRFDEVNTRLADLAEWKRKREAADAEAEKKAKQAADAAAQERGEYEKLAQDRAARILEIERERDQTKQEQDTALARLAEYEAEMERQIKARLKALPEEISAMAPESDPLARFTWLAKAEAAAAKLGQVARPPLGTPPGPRGPGTASATQPTDLAAQKRASGEYAV